MPTDSIWTFQIGSLVPDFGLMHRDQRRALLDGYSITSSARASSIAASTRSVMIEVIERSTIHLLSHHLARDHRRSLRIVVQFDEGRYILIAAACCLAAHSPTDQPPLSGPVTGGSPLLGNEWLTRSPIFAKMGFCLDRDAGATFLLTSSLNWKTFGGFQI
jgi:hypothetical protein